MNGNPKTAVGFHGFSPELFNFLYALSNNNEKEWFDAQRDVYRYCLLEPVKSFTREVGTFLQSLNQDFDAEPRLGRTISRINSDPRSRKNQAPYKPYIDVTFTRRDARWSYSAVMYVGIYSHGISVGFYPSCGRDAGVAPIQRAVLDNRRLFQKYLSERRIPQRYWELAGNEGNETTKWPLPKTAKRWASMDNFVIGEYFNRIDAAIGHRVFLHVVQEILVDLYPLWLFAESENVRDDLELYRENARLLSHPVSKAAD